jgi:NAD(P)-dependent dehydrogenase (short-subunit alcohol dehydrogenase family)
LSEIARSLAGRSAIVTGGSRGIGLAIAQRLLDAGASVLITARRQDSLEQAVALLGPRASGFVAHAADEQAAEACVRDALERFGRLDVLVNNAGTNAAYGPLVEIDHAQFAKTLDVNVWAPILWSRLAWSAAIQSEHGRAIVNVASIGGLIAGANTGVYRISKAALLHATRQLALELAPRVRVNAVAPGLVRTKMAEALWKPDEQQASAGMLLGRIGEPPEIAEAIAFLASDSSAWITGETLVVDGGQLVASSASTHGQGAATAASASTNVTPRASSE